MAYKLCDPGKWEVTLVQSGKWDVAGQIGSLSMVWDGTQDVLGISQPGVRRCGSRLQYQLALSSTLVHCRTFHVLSSRPPCMPVFTPAPCLPNPSLIVTQVPALPLTPCCHFVPPPTRRPALCWPFGRRRAASLCLAQTAICGGRKSVFRRETSSTLHSEALLQTCWEGFKCPVLYLPPTMPSAAT